MFELYIIIGTLSFKLLHHLFLTPAVEPFPVISVHDRVLYYNVTWNEPVSDFLCIYRRYYNPHSATHYNPHSATHGCIIIIIIIIIFILLP